MSRPYATDWEVLDQANKRKGITATLYYSPSLELWWRNGVVYDERSATHNGLIGMGARLHSILEIGK